MPRRRACGSDAASARRSVRIAARRCGAGRVASVRASAAVRRSDRRGDADESQPRHQLLRLDELGRGVVGEVLVAQHLGGAEAQLDRRIVGPLLRCRAAAPSSSLVVDRQRDLEQLVLERVVVVGAGVLPEHGERAVEQLVVLGPAHERRPCRPVRRRRGRSMPTQAIASANAHRGARRHGQPGAAQHAGERDRDLARVRGSRRRTSR